MRILMIAFVSFMILCAVSAVRADETAAERGAGAMRHHALTTRNATLGGSIAASSWTDRASSTSGGGY